MSTQYAYANNYADNNTDSTSALLPHSIENNGGDDEEEIGMLPLEAMVISNSSLCAFMGARSPWANT